MSPSASMPRAAGMARRRLVHLAIGAAIAFALIAVAPGHAPTRHAIARIHLAAFKIGGAH